MTSNVYLTFTGTYETPLWFDSNNVGNYIGKINGYPSIVGNTVVQLIANNATFRLSDAGLYLANNESNTTIKVPNTAQQNNAYFLNANGQWAIPPAPTGLTTIVNINDGFSLINLHFSNGILTAVT